MVLNLELELLQAGVIVLLYVVPALSTPSGIEHQIAPRTHEKRRPCARKVMHICPSQAERALSFHRLSHIQDFSCLLRERGDTLRIRCARKNLGIRRERACIGQDIFGKD